MNLANPEDRRNLTSKVVDSAEFVKLIDSHQRMIYKVCWAYTYSMHDREDLFQEIVGRLWRAYPSYDAARKFSTWMYRIALNVAIDFQRSARRALPAVSLEELTVPVSDVDGQAKTEQLTKLRELLEGLEEADRVIVLLYFEGNSYREIAEVIGIGESNVGTRLSRLRAALRQSANTDTPDKLSTGSSRER